MLLDYSLTLFFIFCEFWDVHLHCSILLMCINMNTRKLINVNIKYIPVNNVPVNNVPV